MERRGSGFKKIVSAYKGHDGYKEGMEPSFLTPWDSFVLILPKFNITGIDGVYVSDRDEIENNHELIGRQGGRQGGQKGGQKNDERSIDIILQLIKDNPAITRNALAETIGISHSAIQKHINRLKVNGVIIRHGGDRGGYWEVSEDKMLDKIRR